MVIHTWERGVEAAPSENVFVATDSDEIMDVCAKYGAQAVMTDAGVSSEMAERMKALERENRELRQANEILRKASAYFAMAELDRRSK
ncbi:MAG: insertion element uncharacterized 12 [Cypionkella sp.]|nr:insertion element uncharacterized 12 [Cypionkella sp.]